MEIYFERAIASQSPGTAYEDIVYAYQLAALCGAYLANSWLKEQKLSPLRINSVWRHWGTHTSDISGSEYVEY